MSQYRTGVVKVNKDSNIVIGSNTRWMDNVATGDIFLIYGIQDSYSVASVISDNQLLLDRDYTGEGANSAAYVISHSFTPTKRYPYPEKNDVEVATILERAFRMLDEDSRLTFYIVAEDNESIFLDDSPNISP